MRIGMGNQMIKQNKINDHKFNTQEVEEPWTEKTPKQIQKSTYNRRCLQSTYLHQIPSVSNDVERVIYSQGESYESTEPDELSQIQTLVKYMSQKQENQLNRSR